jgi:hypothetical protein
MTATQSIVANCQLNVTDTSLSPSQQYITRQLNNPSLLATTVFYDSFAQVISPTTLVITLPASGTVWVVYVRNLGSAGNLTMNFTPVGGVASSLTLVPGGFNLYFNPTEGGGGITALSLTASTGTIPAEVLVGV